MADRLHTRDEGSWLLIRQLYERGDSAFVDELRKIADADRLGAFAAIWYADRRPSSRRLLLEYLDRPLNAFRHEPLVKRLFKLAEKAGDDEVMAGFLVMFDRSVRRARRKRHRYESRNLNNREAADALLKQWESEGADRVNLNNWNDRYYVSASWTSEVAQTPRGLATPRKLTWVVSDPQTRRWNQFSDKTIRSTDELPDHLKKRLPRCRLFSIHTRNYLRRRVWRYFRRLGKANPERYIAAVTAALKIYRDEDVPDGLALIDNWGLVHILFHRCPALVAKPNGWTLAPDHSLAELTPAPIYEHLWKAAPPALLDLLKGASCRPVRQWAIRMIRRDAAAVLGGLPLEELIGLLGHEDADVVALAAESLRQASGLKEIPLDRWLALMETPNPESLEILCELMATHLAPEKITLEQAVLLTMRRPLPLARLGFGWLRSRKPQTEAECRSLLGLTEAEAEPVRPELVRWARKELSQSAYFDSSWVLEYLDSRHGDVREEGWVWFTEESRARDNIELWRKLLESPYDDVRLPLVADLEERVTKPGRTSPDQGKLDQDLVRFLWASVLLNIHRGNRSKPVVIRQIVRRLERKPEEAAALLPLLSVALRSVRGPEWRAGLAGVVQLLERHPELETVVRQSFPELQLNLMTNDQ